MTEKLEFPELKRAYLQSLPSEQAILLRMRHGRQVAQTADKRALYAFGLVGVMGLAALILVLTSNKELPSTHLSPEPLQPTSFGVRNVPTPDSSNFVTTPRELLDQDPHKGEPAVVDQPPAPKTNRRKSTSTQKLNQTDPPSAKATWSEVGTLLRNGQEAEAQNKIAELAQSEDVETREGALLFQLRQRVQSAHKARSAIAPEVQAALRKLADGGSTSSIRLTAKRLLADSN